LLISDNFLRCNNLLQQRLWFWNIDTLSSCLSNNCLILLGKFLSLESCQKIYFLLLLDLSLISLFGRLVHLARGFKLLHDEFLLVLPLDFQVDHLDGATSVILRVLTGGVVVLHLLGRAVNLLLIVAVSWG